MKNNFPVSPAAGWMLTLSAVGPLGQSMDFAIRLLGDGDDAMRVSKICRQIISAAEEPTGTLAMALIDT